jgi:hypothetical protein
MTHYQLVVFSNALEGRDADFNDWYDNQHLDDVLAIPGFYRAQRMTIANPLSPEPAEYKYLAIYEFEADDLDKTLGYFFSLSGTDKMPMSDAMDKKAKPAVYRVMGPAKELSAPTPWPA